MIRPMRVKFGIHVIEKDYWAFVASCLKHLENSELKGKNHAARLALASKLPSSFAIKGKSQIVPVNTEAKRT
jgi:hypothetical protein